MEEQAQSLIDQTSMLVTAYQNIFTFIILILSEKHKFFQAHKYLDQNVVVWLVR